MAHAVASITDAPIIPFTQFVAPNGLRRPVTIQVSDEVAGKARMIIRRGFVFECEVLMSGEVSLTITDPEEGDADIQMCMNGPGVREAVERLVNRFAEQVSA